MKKKLIAFIAAASIGISFATPCLAAEPRLNEIYQAANSGQIERAQSMIEVVLKAHPNSAKAHYVEAELLARQGKIKQAADELATTEKLAPGLPFVKPEAVSSLKQLLGEKQTKQTVEKSPVAKKDESGGSMMPMLFTLALVAFGIYFIKSRVGTKTAGAQNQAYGNSYAQNYTQKATQGYQPAYPNNAYAANTVSETAPAAARSGLGSRIADGLATGAAVGIGAMAGQALFNHFAHSNKSESGNNNSNDLNSLANAPIFSNNDMSSNNFGITDNGSWDDSSASSSSSDWE